MNPINNNWLMNIPVNADIIETNYAGRNCYQCVVRHDSDMGGKWGDNPPKIHKRYNFASKHKLTIPAFTTYYFSTCIPSDWVFSGDTNIATMHNVNWGTDYKGPSNLNCPLNFFIKDQNYVINKEVIAGKMQQIYSGLILPDQWDDWEVSIKYDLTNGFIKVLRNGEKIAYNSGQTMNEYHQGIYLKIGPYVWGQWPTDVLFRKMYVRI